MIETFEYNIKTKHDFTVVTWTGPMTRDARVMLEQCRQDLLIFESKIIILYFKQVQTLDATIFRQLTILQHDVRKKNKSLKLVGLGGDKRQLLIDSGVVRLNELKASLEEAFNLKLG